MHDWVFRSHEYKKAASEEAAEQMLCYLAISTHDIMTYTPLAFCCLIFSMCSLAAAWQALIELKFGIEAVLTATLVL
jgi:hypothetical protein